MPQEALNGLEVVVGNQQVACEGVPKSVRRNPFGDGRAVCGLFNSGLNTGLMQVIAAVFSEVRNEGERRRGEEPLPDELFGGVLVFLLKPPREERSGVRGGDVLTMQPAHQLQLLASLVRNGPSVAGERGGWPYLWQKSR